MMCCIFGGAEISDYSGVFIPKGAFVIAADGGYAHCRKVGVVPDLIVGDFDSIGEEPPAECPVIKASADKDDTDLMLCVKEAICRGADYIEIYGADGGRMGHTFAAVETLEYIRSRKINGVIKGNGCDMLIFSAESAQLQNRGYKYISVFSLTDFSEVNMSGLLYSGRYIFNRDFPLGVSNEFKSDCCEINVIRGKILIILEK